MSRGAVVDGENDVITYSRTGLFGQKIRMGRRTAAHLDSTISALAKQHPGATLKIIQGAYNSTIAASAGTHDRDAVLDVEIVGLDWWEAQAFLRAQGWGAWFRHTGTWAKQSAWHIHMISLGCTGPVGKYIDGGLSTVGRLIASSQTDDYHAHAFGLSGAHLSGSDRSWFPADIDAVVFNYSAYLDAKEHAGMNNVQRIRHDTLESIRVNSPKIPEGRKIARAWVAALKRLASGGPDLKAGK